MTKRKTVPRIETATPPPQRRKTTLKIARNAKPNPRTPRFPRRRNPKRRPHLRRITAPRAATHDMALAARIDPCVRIPRRARVVVVPAILDPLGHIAFHVEKAEPIRRKTLRRRRAPVAVAVVRECLRPAALRRRAVALAREIADRLVGIAIGPTESARPNPHAARIRIRPRSADDNACPCAARASRDTLACRSTKHARPAARAPRARPCSRRASSRRGGRRCGPTLRRRSRSNRGARHRSRTSPRARTRRNRRR